MPGVGGLYAATKWALEGVAESLRYEVRPFGIDVAILEPGAFATRVMSKVMVAKEGRLWCSSFRSFCPLGGGNAVFVPPLV